MWVNLGRRDSSFINQSEDSYSKSFEENKINLKKIPNNSVQLLKISESEKSKEPKIEKIFKM